ncbi:MAG: BlaI/MecI/CopY family transcriptional regulator [Clostridia bacterium]|nr:BlaI/MecI/CopY family transcriptional regulator [Clostridia bacterium]
MNEIQLGPLESRFADMIWQNEPVMSPELCRMALEELNWRKSTTYTVLRRLCDKGIFQNEKGEVTSLISRDDFYAARSRAFVRETFDGSLPAFIVAFAKDNKLGEEEVKALRELVKQYEGGE